MKSKYLLEYTWGIDNPVHEEQEIETDNIGWSLDQIVHFLPSKIQDLI